MNARTGKTEENKSKAIANNLAKAPGGGETPVQFIDNRPETVVQRKLQAMANAGKTEAVQQSKNETGLPDQLKSGIENLSGISMDQVKVHYNSAQPQQLNALAYAQGSDIHVAPGQEKHLPHEAWHVVQQAQGRVKPTMQLKNGMAINDNNALEKEADEMGEMAQRPGHLLNGREGIAQKKDSNEHTLSFNSNIVQLRCNPQQLRWAANYQNSGLNITDLFTDENLMNGDSHNNDNRGIFAHEHIQEKYGNWIAEYGIPPTLLDQGWCYADMVSQKRIYEIKPGGGLEDAVGQATRYMNKANQTDAGHTLATVALVGRDLILSRQISIHDYFTGQEENDTVNLYLMYHTNRAGEILYEWVIVNESKQERKKIRDDAKKKEKNDKVKKEKDEKMSKGIPKIGTFFGKSSAMGKASMEKASRVIEPMEVSNLVEVENSGGMGGGMGIDGGGMGIGGGGMQQGPFRFNWNMVPPPQVHQQLSRPQLLLAVANGQVGMDDIYQWLRDNGYPEEDLEAEAVDILRAAYRV